MARMHVEGSLRTRATKKNRRGSLFVPYLFLAPALAFFMVFSIIPVMQALYYSFTDYNMFTVPNWVGLQNYKRILGDGLFYKTLGNSLSFFLGTTPFLVIIPIFVAILVNRQLKGVKVFRMIYYFPVILTSVITATMWRWIYEEKGVVNFILLKLNIVQEEVHWLTSPDTALTSLKIITIWMGIGYYMVIYLAGLQSIPNELYESARIDGAGVLRRHFSITIPLLVPSIAIVSIMSTLSAIKAFELMFVMTKGGPIDSTKTVVYYLYESAFQDLRMGYASAVGFMIFIIIFIISIINIKITDAKTVRY